MFQMYCAPWVLANDANEVGHTEFLKLLNVRYSKVPRVLSLVISDPVVLKS